MTKNNTHSNLQMTFLLAIAYAQQQPAGVLKRHYVPGHTIARLAGYDKLTTRHRRLLKELAEHGWLYRTKWDHTWRYGLTPAANANLQEAVAPSYCFPAAVDEVPF